MVKVHLKRYAHIRFFYIYPLLLYITSFSRSTLTNLDHDTLSRVMTRACGWSR